MNFCHSSTAAESGCGGRGGRGEWLGGSDGSQDSARSEGGGVERGRKGGRGGKEEERAYGGREGEMKGGHMGGGRKKGKD